MGPGPDIVAVTIRFSGETDTSLHIQHAADGHIQAAGSDDGEMGWHPPTAGPRHPAHASLHHLPEDLLYLLLNGQRQEM